MVHGIGARAPIPKFVFSCGPTFNELRNQRNSSKHIDSSAAFLFEVPGSDLPLVVQELQIGGTRSEGSKAKLPVRACRGLGISHTTKPAKAWGAHPKRRGAGQPVV